MDAYFEERILDDDETPMNDFTRDQGDVFYDHDWVERSFMNDGGLTALITGHSYSDDYMPQVIDIARSRVIIDANAFIMADAEEIPSPRSVAGADYQIWYIGKFKCKI